MAVQVCTGAMVACTFGAVPAVFTASSADVDATAPAGVITDVSVANIPTFGVCVAPANPAVAASPQHTAPCLPVLQPWTPGSARVTINGVNALDDTSQCVCAWLGVVTVMSPGQSNVTTE